MLWQFLLDLWIQRILLTILRSFLIRMLLWILFKCMLFVLGHDERVDANAQNTKKEQERNEMLREDKPPHVDLLVVGTIRSHLQHRGRAPILALFKRRQLGQLSSRIARHRNATTRHAQLLQMAGGCR